MMNARLKEVLEKTRKLEIKTRGLVEEIFAGKYQSRFRGRGMDLDSVREYVPGDEVRTIDWNVTARAGKPFVKNYREERELNVMLVVDVSASGDFGSATRTKRELAAELASLIALSAVRSQDRVGLVMFSDRIEAMVPAERGRTHALRLVREILASEPVGTGTDLATALETAAKVAKRRSVIFVISDFQLALSSQAEQARLERALGVLSVRHDVVAIAIRDPREKTLPNAGVLQLEDAETGEVLVIDTRRRRVRERFRNEAEARWSELRQIFRHACVDTLELDSTKDYLPSLVKFFTTRTRRR